MIASLMGIWIIQIGNLYHPTLSLDAAIQGKAGNRNIRSGGDTVSLESSDWNAYMCYVVYRSFKEKPP